MFASYAKHCLLARVGSPVLLKPSARRMLLLQHHGCTLANCGSTQAWRSSTKQRWETSVPQKLPFLLFSSRLWYYVRHADALERILTQTMVQTQTQHMVRVKFYKWIAQPRHPITRCSTANTKRRRPERSGMSLDNNLLQSTVQRRPVASPYQADPIKRGLKLLLGREKGRCFWS